MQQAWHPVPEFTTLKGVTGANPALGGCFMAVRGIRRKQAC